MSLRKLLKWNYFTIQTNKFVSKSDSGSLQRKDGWLDLSDSINLQGNLQATVSSQSKGRNDTILDFKLKELQSYYTLFHSYDNKQFDTNCRILVNRNPRIQVVDKDLRTKENTRVFEFIGIREPVAKPGFNLYECYFREIHNQTI